MTLIRQQEGIVLRCPTLILGGNRFEFYQGTVNPNGFSSVAPGKFRDNTLKQTMTDPFHVLPDSSSTVTLPYLIQCFVTSEVDN